MRGNMHNFLLNRTVHFVKHSLVILFSFRFYKMVGRKRKRWDLSETSFGMEESRPTGFRIMNIELLQDALDEAQGCGHNKLVLVDLLNTVDKLASAYQFICQVCSSTVDFFNSPPSTKGYRLNEDLEKICPGTSLKSFVSFFDDQRRVKEEMATINPDPSNPQTGVDYDEVFVKMEPEEDSKEILDFHNFQTYFIKEELIESGTNPETASLIQFDNLNWIPVMGGMVTLLNPGIPLTCNPAQFIKTTSSKYKIPPGVYKYVRKNGLESVLLVKDDDGNYDDLLKFFITVDKFDLKVSGFPLKSGSRVSKEKKEFNAWRRQVVNWRTTLKNTGLIPCEKCTLGFSTLIGIESHYLLCTGEIMDNSEYADCHLCQARCTQSDLEGHMIKCLSNRSHFTSSENSSSSGSAKAGNSKRKLETGNKVFKVEQPIKRKKPSKALAKAACSRRTPLSIFSIIYTERLKNQGIVGPNISSIVLDTWIKMLDTEKDVFRRGQTDHDLHQELITKNSPLSEKVFNEIERRLDES
ncbi:uncharacterized protein LOC111707233 [Eurytemora carolleeae]|uniref:uncharacterized protein LOC111707233 n=1 Tax=Eurytemora carolleeae TaxID=1294199 RepID=UPI000C78081F|nr:uncharacterized protein LOC111707233 [Eurytemora carolleeae]|eukprot:XP_023336065.1 uncharacterized protein LOC111707233 [Eurytemora affinis]